MRFRISIIYLILCLSSMVRTQVGLSADEAKLFHLLNEERKKAALPLFQWNYHLAQAARDHTKWMVERKTLSHRFSGEPELSERAGAAGARFDSAAENVANGELSADTVGDVHGSLMYSPGHRANILNRQYNEVGLAVVTSEGQMYVTEDFAHTFPTYTEKEFREGVIAAFNKARQARKLPIVTVIDNPRMHELACAENDKPLLPHLSPPVLDEIVFTSFDPAQLPGEMQRAVGDPGLHRLSLGTCFHPDKQHGFASFWVVAAFYP
jgi:uncharacterized protein YkwD